MGLLGEAAVHVCWEGTRPRRALLRCHTPPQLCGTDAKEGITADFGVMLLMNVSHKLAEKHPSTQTSTLALASLGFIPKHFLSIYQSKKGQTLLYEILYF